MKALRMLAAAAALTLSFAAADAARAATVMHDTQGNVVVDAAPGETNNMSVQAGSSGGTVVLLDSGGAPLQAWDDGCEQVMDSMVECGTSGYVELWLDDGNDRASVDIFLPANRACSCTVRAATTTSAALRASPAWTAGPATTS